jgi:Tfp pilus assembly protein PilZ
MPQIEKRVFNENHEKRENVRLDEYRPISINDLKAGICHKATMLNYSKNGIYFETDSFLAPGAEIYLGTENSSYASFINEFKCKLARIIWRKKLKKSFYNYGYGVKFISDDNTNLQKCGKQEKGIDSRKHSRKQYSKSVLYAVDNQILDGRSQNISPSGIFLKTKYKLKVGQKLILSLPSKTKNGLKFRGEVVWSNHEGVGIKFLKKMRG